MTLPNDAHYRVTSVGVTSSFVTFTHDIDIIACQGGGKCRVPLIGGFRSVRDPNTSLAGVIVMRLENVTS